MLFLDEIHRMSRPGGGDALPRDGGLPRRRDRRQGPGRDRDPARDPAVHPGRRDHPGRAAAGAAARPVRLHGPPGVLRPRRPAADRRPLREPAQGVASTRTRRAEIASRSRGTPRIANRLLRRVRDYAQVRADGVVTRPLARDALALFEVDEQGLDRLDLAVLDALCRRFGGGPVGLGTLAVAVGEERETVEEVAEPFLVQVRLPGPDASWAGRDSGRLGAPRPAGAGGRAVPRPGPALRRRAVSRRVAGPTPGTAAVTSAVLGCRPGYRYTRPLAVFATAAPSCRRARRSSRVECMAAFLPLVLLVARGLSPPDPEAGPQTVPGGPAALQSALSPG